MPHKEAGQDVAILDEARVEILEREDIRTAYVQPFDTTFLGSAIRVHQDKGIDSDKWRPAMVAWPSIGEVTPEESMSYSKAMELATDIAERWNEETGNA